MWTKEKLLKVIENMPMNTEICAIGNVEFMGGVIPVVKPAIIEYDKKHNRLIIKC